MQLYDEAGDADGASGVFLLPVGELELDYEGGGQPSVGAGTGLFLFLSLEVSHWRHPFPVGAFSCAGGVSGSCGSDVGVWTVASDSQLICCLAAVSMAFCQWLVTLCLTLELVRHRWCSSTIWETSQGVMLRLPDPVGEADLTVLSYCYSLLLESTASFRATDLTHPTVGNFADGEAADGKINKSRSRSTPASYMAWPVVSVTAILFRSCTDKSTR